MLTAIRSQRSLSEQLRRQQGQLEEFFSRVDVLKSTEGAASLLDAADSAFEGIFLGGDDPARAGPGGRMVPGLRRGVGDDSKAFGGLGARAGEEGDAAAAVRKSAYHLRQLKQVGAIAACVLSYLPSTRRCFMLCRVLVCFAISCYAVSCPFHLQQSPKYTLL